MSAPARKVLNADRHVYWMDTSGGQRGDGAWYWIRLDANGERDGEPVGPFSTAIAAGMSARASLLPATAQKE